MQISKILNELESLLNRSNIDENWSDWLREFAEKTATTPRSPERDEILHEIQNCENSLSRLSIYLPETDASGECPPRELDYLINVLDFTVRRELGE